MRSRFLLPGLCFATYCRPHRFAVTVIAFRFPSSLVSSPLLALPIDRTLIARPNRHSQLITADEPDLLVARSILFRPFDRIAAAHQHIDRHRCPHAWLPATTRRLVSLLPTDSVSTHNQNKLVRLRLSGAAE